MSAEDESIPSPPFDRNLFGQYIRVALHKKGQTQVWLAQQAGVTEGYISQIFRGKHYTPSLEIALRIFQALDISLDEFARAAGLPAKQPIDVSYWTPEVERLLRAALDSPQEIQSILAHIAEDMLLAEFTRNPPTKETP